jgi:hypothetical protein
MSEELVSNGSCCTLQHETKNEHAFNPTKHYGTRFLYE